MDQAQVEVLARLRMLVGYLGEQGQHGWWPSNFLGAGSNAFLDPVFARTALLAQYHGITRAAAKVHDEYIGLGRAYHLFRLPEELELRVHSAVQGDRFAQALTGLLSDSAAALTALREVGTAALPTAEEGPTLAGGTAAVWAATACCRWRTRSARRRPSTSRSCSIASARSPRSSMASACRAARRCAR